MAEAASTSSEPTNKETASSTTTVEVQEEDGCTLIETHTRITYKQWKDEKRKERVSHYFMSCLTVLVCEVPFTDTRLTGFPPLKFPSLQRVCHVERYCNFSCDLVFLCGCGYYKTHS